MVEPPVIGSYWLRLKKKRQRDQREIHLYAGHDTVQLKRGWSQHAAVWISGCELHRRWVFRMRRKALHVLGTSIPKHFPFFQNHGRCLIRGQIALTLACHSQHWILKDVLKPLSTCGASKATRYLMRIFKGARAFLTSDILLLLSPFAYLKYKTVV